MNIIVFTKGKPLLRINNSTTLPDAVDQSSCPSIYLLYDLASFLNEHTVHSPEILACY